MSYVVARMQKMKSGNLSGSYKHNERIFNKHSNKDIDTEKSHLNYELTDRDRSVSYDKQIKQFINDTKLSNRAIRKDAVLCNEWIITSDKTFFEDMNYEETRNFFETAKDYFSEKYGENNIAYAMVHLDENTPHMHLGLVPMKDGKLSSKELFGSREKLKEIQDEFPKYLCEHGYDLQRGEEGSKKKHLETAEFKEKQRLLEKADKIIAEKNSNIDVANKKLYELESHIEEKKQTLVTLEDKEWEIVGTLEQYKKEIQELADFRHQKQALKKFELEELKKDNLGKRSIDGRLKIDRETYDKLFQTASTNLSKNTQLRNDKVKLERQLSESRLKQNNLSKQLLERDKLVLKNQGMESEIHQLKAENTQLQTKVEKLTNQVKTMAKRLSVWKKNAKKYMPNKEFKNTVQLVNKIRPPKIIAHSAIKFVQRAIEKSMN